MPINHRSGFHGESLFVSPLIIVCTSVDIVQNNDPTKRTSIKLASAAKGEVRNNSNPINSRIVSSDLFIIACFSQQGDSKRKDRSKKTQHNIGGVSNFSTSRLDIAHKRKASAKAEPPAELERFLRGKACTDSSLLSSIFCLLFCQNSAKIFL